MAGTQMGYLKGKMKLVGKQPAGAMLTRLNDLKKPPLSTKVKYKGMSMKCKNCGMNHTTESCAMKGSAMKYKKSVGHKPKGAHGRAAVHALGRTRTTGNFKRIEKAHGKGAAIAAFQNALRAHKK